VKQHARSDIADTCGIGALARRAGLALHDEAAGEASFHFRNDLVLARGRLKQGKYEKDGETRYTVDLICTEFSRLAQPSAAGG
jgi:hypothetical protein